ncbi:MAG: metallophosphoesterase [Phycisphaerales bacterium]|nr:metallophosphoesterase [Phycisphaerales bacterium]
MATCFFATDLHGCIDRYQKLFNAIEAERPNAVFLGGDLLPSAASVLANHRDAGDFSTAFIELHLRRIREVLANSYPHVFLILGNDDPRVEEDAIADAANKGVWDYMHGCRATFGPFEVFGYNYVPPTPFLLKDWERYDVGCYVDPGCVSPEEGIRTVPVSAREARNTTIQADLDRLVGDTKLNKAILLFHSPPHATKLDRAALDGKLVDHAPVDVHVGSIAIRRFIESRQPLLTLHGHIHESARLTGAWKDKIGNTICLSAAHDGPELALVRFDPANPSVATRELI